MALLFADGFDLYATLQDFLDAGWAWTYASTPATVSRTGRGAATTGYGFAGLTRVLVAPTATQIVGFGARFVDLNPGAASPGDLCFFRFAHPTLASSFDIGIDAAGRLFVKAGTSAIASGRAMTTAGALWTAPLPEIPLTWNYHEFKVTFSAAGAGAFTYRKNNVLQVALSGVTTCAAAGTPSAVGFPRNTANSDGIRLNVDDFYVCDDSGAVNNDFLGDVEIHARLPTSDVLAAWTRNTGASNFSAVDEVTSDGDTTYVEATAAAIDRYGVAALPANVGQVHAIIVSAVARKTESGAALFRNNLLSGATVGLGATAGLGLTYGVVQDIFPLDPATGAAWTVAAANAVKFGPERV